MQLNALKNQVSSSHSQIQVQPQEPNIHKLEAMLVKKFEQWDKTMEQLKT